MKTLRIIYKILVVIIPLVFLGVVGFLGFEYAFDRTMVIMIEAGSQLPEAGEFFTKYREGATYATEITEEQLLTPGSYPVEIYSWKQYYHCELRVVDTVAPQGTPVPVTTMVGQEVAPEAFVTDIVDISEVKVFFAAPVDFSKDGQSLVSLCLQDEAGNRTFVNAGLKVIRDTKPPVITGVQDQTIYEGETISYKKGITYSDDYTEEDKLKLTIDNSMVDLDTAGEYWVTYTVTDEAGNEAQVTAVITVVNKEEEDAEKARQELQAKLDPLVEKAVKSCYKEGQSDREYLKKMFNYVRNHMSYTNSSDKTAELEEAYRGFTKHRGDCFTYFSVLKQMMTYAGFETCDVRRINGRTNHFWSLVKVDGEWYHIDSCPRSASHHKEWICFLRTDSELEYFSTKLVKGYYTFDTSLVPRTP